MSDTNGEQKEKSQVQKDNATVIAEALKVLQEDIITLESHIHNVETQYLEDTSIHGNIIKGWDGYLDSKITKPSTLRRPKVFEKDRVFSASSSTSQLTMNKNLFETENKTIAKHIRGKGYKKKSR